MSSRKLRSTYKGATVDDDGDLRCQCGFDMRVCEVGNKKSLNFRKKYLVCKKDRDDSTRCKVYIWHDEVIRVKQLVPRFSEPQTPKRTRDIRAFGIVTPSKSTPRHQTTREAISGGINDDSKTVALRASKRPATPMKSESNKRTRTIETPPQTPCLQDSGVVTSKRISNPSSPELSAGPSRQPQKPTERTGRLRDRSELFRRDVSRSPTKSTNHATPYMIEEDEEDEFTDWDDNLIQKLILAADQAQIFQNSQRQGSNAGSS